MKIPQVGIAVIVKKDNRVLMGLRRGAHGADTWALPGGKLHFEESIEECAKREVFEETGVTIGKPKFFAVTDDFFEKEKLHFVTIILSTPYKSGEAKVKEPAKCEKWEWHNWNTLPKPLFLPLKNLLKQKRHLQLP